MISSVLNERPLLNILQIKQKQLCKLASHVILKYTLEEEVSDDFGVKIYFYRQDTESKRHMRINVSV